MHELSIAMSITDGAIEEAAKYPGMQVNAVLLKVGVLSGVVKDALVFSYDLACAGTPLEGSRLEIETVGAAILCPNCKTDRLARSMQDLACVVCGALSSTVVRGRELTIVGLELE